MKEIQLTQGKVALVDDDDYERVNQFKWCADISYSTIYASRQSYGKKIYMHRLVMDTQPKIECDHIDGNGLNNQKSNLRNCTHKENLRNKKIHKNKINCSSKFKGVFFRKEQNTYQAYINVDKKHIYLGCSKDEYEAALLYDNAAKLYFGEFAFTNF